MRTDKVVCAVIDMLKIFFTRSWSGMEKYQWVTCYNMKGKEEKKDAKQQQ